MAAKKKAAQPKKPKANGMNGHAFLEELQQVADTQPPTPPPEPELAPAPQLPYKVDGPVYHEGCMHLSPNDLLRYELLLERVQSNLQGIGMAKLEKENAINNANKEIERIRLECLTKTKSCDERVLQLVSTGKAREEELRRFQVVLSTVYGNIDLTKLSYDDTSGKMFLEGTPLLSPDGVPALDE